MTQTHRETISSQRIIYTRPDGGVSVVHPNPAARHVNETDAEFMLRVGLSAIPPDATNIRLLEDDGEARPPSVAPSPVVRKAAIGDP